MNTITDTSADQDFNDPLLGSNFKGYPRTQPPRRRSEVGAAAPGARKVIPLLSARQDGGAAAGTAGTAAPGCDTPNAA